MWYEVRLLQVPDRERMTELWENNKLVDLKKDVNGINEELLRENETEYNRYNPLYISCSNRYYRNNY